MWSQEGYSTGSELMAGIAGEGLNAFLRRRRKPLVLSTVLV
jgi:hypothetical protein